MIFAGSLKLPHVLTERSDARQAFLHLKKSSRFEPRNKIFRDIAQPGIHRLLLHVGRIPVDHNAADIEIHIASRSSADKSANTNMVRRPSNPEYFGELRRSIGTNLQTLEI